MAREVVQLHTIDQWLQQDPVVRNSILKNIRLKDRLEKWLDTEDKKPPLKEPKWAPCNKCNHANETPDQEKGWVLLEPRRPGIHPSQIAHPCLLKIYYEMIGTTQKQHISPRLRRIFDLGHAVHHMFQAYGLKGAWGPGYVPESTIAPEYQELANLLMLEGSADAEHVMVIDDILGGPIYEVGVVHEYKTINATNFKTLTSPKPDHLRQALVYSAALNRPVVVYLYMNKDDCSLTDFPIEFNQERWAEIYNKASILKQYYDRKEQPAGAPGYHCKDCSYAHVCTDRNRR